jgi:Holliday junction resolvase RusA-like endonuclease
MPTPRPRARVISGAGRKPLAVFYSPKEYREWQEAAAAALKSAPAQYTDGPVIVSVLCVAARPKTTKLLMPKPDSDNYGKGVLDAITKDGRFWSDDTQVADLHVSKRWSRADRPVGITVTIAPMDPQEL